MNVDRNTARTDTAPHQAKPHKALHQNPIQTARTRKDQTRVRIQTARIFGSLVLGSTLSLLGSARPQLAPDPHPTLSIAMASAHAVQLADGKTHFVAVPRLTDTGSSNTTIQAYGARHYLTLDLPAEASEALGAVTIQQQEGSDRRWRYALDRLHAFSVLPDQQRQPWPLMSSFDRETHTLTLTFDPPVPPGTILTLALTPRRNPAYDGIYLWGITAFPAGEDPQGQFLGYGRFHFYRPDRRWWW